MRWTVFHPALLGAKACLFLLAAAGCLLLHAAWPSSAPIVAPIAFIALGIGTVLLALSILVYSMMSFGLHLIDDNATKPMTRQGSIPNRDLRVSHDREF